MIRVLGIGDNVADKYLHTKTIYPGGNALNIAVFAKMFGTEAGYLGTFGDDEIGKHVYSVCWELGLDLSHCRLEIGENGCARVHLVDGDRVFLQGNKGGISRTKPPVLTELDEEYIAGYDLIHTSVYSFMEQELPKIRRAGKFVSMDFSNRLEEAYFQQCCPYVDCAEISSGISRSTAAGISSSPPEAPRAPSSWWTARPMSSPPASSRQRIPWAREIPSSPASW